VVILDIEFEYYVVLLISGSEAIVVMVNIGFCSHMRALLSSFALEEDGQGQGLEVAKSDS